MPSPVDLRAKRKVLGRLPLDHLRLRGEVFRKGSHLYIAGRCGFCGKVRDYLVYNLERGRTTRCRCRRAVKYEKNPLAEVIGYRYDAIRQRCENRSNPLYRQYGGRGIRCRFGDRESFVLHVLSLAENHQPPIRTVKRLRNYRIERIRDSAHFARGNLRLVSRSE